jgi:hypothetical protein
MRPPGSTPRYLGGSPAGEARPVATECRSPSTAGTTHSATTPGTQCRRYRQRDPWRDTTRRSSPVADPSVRFATGRPRRFPSPAQRRPADFLAPVHRESAYRTVPGGTMRRAILGSAVIGGFALLVDAGRVGSRRPAGRSPVGRTSAADRTCAAPVLRRRPVPDAAPHRPAVPGHPRPPGTCWRCDPGSWTPRVRGAGGGRHRSGPVSGPFQRVPRWSPPPPATSRSLR